MSNSVASELRSAISSIRDKSAEVSDSDFFSDLAEGRVEAAKGQITYAQNSVNRLELQLDDVNSKLNPPPTKEVSEGCGGTKTVVDREAEQRLLGDKRNIQSQLETAKSSVDEAEQEAQIAAMDALEKAGISKEKQSELESVLTKIDLIKDKMEKGETVEDNEITGALGDLNKAFNGLESNGIVKEAFYEPVEEDLEEILQYVTNPVSNVDADQSEVIPPDGTVDKDLYDIGIRGDDIAELVGIMSDLAKVADGMGNGEDVDPVEMQSIHDRYMAQRSGFTNDQLSSTVISDFEENFDNIIETSGVNIEKIKAEAGVTG